MDLCSKTTCTLDAVSYTHLRAHETVLDLVCRLLLEKKKNIIFCFNFHPFHVTPLSSTQYIRICHIFLLI
ncbi:hypothetical protein PVA38_11835 [Streptococcus pneumoniae D39]|nr:hypothetical protein PVA38_11835 [Streptococcus pneumoniae D39]